MMQIFVLFFASKSAQGCRFASECNHGLAISKDVFFRSGARQSVFSLYKKMQCKIIFNCISEPKNVCT